MNIRLTCLLIGLVMLSGCAMTRFSDGNASGYRNASREECVPYARRVSGIPIYGDAYTWWDKAAGVYMRGSRPVPGAVLVLSKTNRLRYGHVAVVANVMSPREMNVTHTNWGDDFMSRRITYELQRVQDMSAANDWTSVRFWNRETGAYGFPYAAKGFIYKARVTETMATPVAAPMMTPITGPVMAPAVGMKPIMQPAVPVRRPTGSGGGGSAPMSGL